MSETLPSEQPVPKSSNALALFLISVLGLFLELMLIRWIATEIRIFAYLQNTILVVCFLGLGMGCYTCRQKIDFREILIPMLVLVGLLAVPFTRRGLHGISGMLSLARDFVIWAPGQSQDLPRTLIYLGVGLTTSYFIMRMIWQMFIPIGRLLGRLMDDHPNTIVAYSINVVGSLLGTTLFVLLCAVSLPPIVWCAVLAMLLAYFLITMSPTRNLDFSLIMALVALSWFAGTDWEAISTHWSAYQKLAVWQNEPNVPGTINITVNNTGYQGIMDLRPSEVAAKPERYVPAEMRGHSQYDVPLLMHPNPQDVLIVGAGSGNDIAGALRNGAQHVVGVEIDPVITVIGKKYHPEKPYDSPKVELVIDDARSYFARSQQRFDVIIFGLLDSHTMTAMSNARLDHYVYTKESLDRAHSLLKPGGIVVVSFSTAYPYIADRLAGTLRATFGTEPLVFMIPFSNFGWGGVIFVAGDPDAIRKQIDAQPKLAALIKDWQTKAPNLTYRTRIAVDDWPYIYLESPKIPSLFYMLGGLLVLLFFHGMRSLGEDAQRINWSASDWHFFFLGAAFLLLEVQNVSKAAVVLGNTWQVNAVIISAVLLMILLANAIAAWFPKLPLPPVYVCLIGSCIGLYFVDLASFSHLDYAVKAVVCGGLVTLPMLFSGIVFIRSFAATSEKHAALGANLFGALAGAVLQSLTFITGIKALLLVVALLYTMAVLIRPARLQRATNPETQKANETPGGSPATA